MAGKDYFLITSLPTPGPLGSKPPISLAELVGHALYNRSARELIQAIFLGDDLLQRQSFLAGELKDVSPTVLTAAQVRNQEPLPAWLEVREQQPGGPSPIDSLWAAYYRHAIRVAGRLGSDFLTGWVIYEVAFRNALVVARAKALGLDAEMYLVEPSLAPGDLDFDSVLAEWSAAPNPLAGLRVLDAARWAWLTEHDAYYTFGDDELAAYAAKLMLLHRWHRLSEHASASQAHDAEQPTERTLP